MAIYKGVNIRQVTDFLEKNQDKHYKLLTTPEGFTKIKEAMQAVDIDMYTECFILFDKTVGTDENIYPAYFLIGSELSVQEAKSMLKQVYKENGTEHRTRHHNKGAGTICRGGKGLETRQ